MPIWVINPPLQGLAAGFAEIVAIFLRKTVIFSSLWT